MEINLTNHLLIAMPTLKDETFARTVTYICEHTEQGAMGLVINRASELKMHDILSHLNIQEQSLVAGEQQIYMGGPVQPERGFVLHSSDKVWNTTLRISEQICVTASRDILEAMANDQGPQRSLIALGYAGWAGGQLEREISANSWLSVPLHEAILFELPDEERWQAAARLLGVDLTLLSAAIGHA